VGGGPKPTPHNFRGELLRLAVDALLAFRRVVRVAYCLAAAVVVNHALLVGCSGGGAELARGNCIISIGHCYAISSRNSSLLRGSPLDGCPEGVQGDSSRTRCKDSIVDTYESLRSPSFGKLWGGPAVTPAVVCRSTRGAVQ